MENPRVVEESYKQYVEHMKKKTDKESFPMPDESLEAIHRSSEQDSVSLFNSRKIGDNVEPYLKDLKVFIIIFFFGIVRIFLFIWKINCRIKYMPSLSSTKELIDRNQLRLAKLFSTLYLKKWMTKCHRPLIKM